MDIESENQKYIRNVFGNTPSPSGSVAKFKSNYELIRSVLEHRSEFGIISDADLERHHNATKKYIKTVTI